MDLRVQLYWRRWQGNGYISRYRRRAPPRHQNVTKIGSSSVSQHQQQPAVGHWCHIRTQPLLLHHLLRFGTFHSNCRQFCSFAIFCTFPQDSKVFSRNHHPSTHHYLIYHYFKYRNNCVFFPEENSSMLWYGVLLKSISSSNLLSIRQRRILQSPASRVTALRHYCCIWLHYAQYPQ